MARPRDAERPIIRRDSEGKAQTASSWESLVERLIREAQEAGAFDGLPGRGRPLSQDDDTYAGDMASANRLLRNAGAAPPWIEADKVARAQLRAIELILERASRAPAGAQERFTSQLETAMDAYDEAVHRLETLAPTARQQRRRIDRATTRRRLAGTDEPRRPPG